MHLSTLGRVGTGIRTGGGATQRVERRGSSPPRCPSGARSLRTGQYGTGVSVTSWRDCEMPAPRAAPPPPPPPAPIITVSPAIQTQVSPQISPVMTQQQASPGASVQAQPISTPGGQRAATAPQQDVERILEAERARMAAEAALEEERRAAEMRELQRQYAAAETQRAAQAAEWRAAEEQRRAEAEAAAAEAEAADTAAFVTGAPSPIMPPVFAPEVATTMAPPTEPAPEVSTEKKDNMLPILLAAAAAVGLFVMSRQKRGRKR